MKVTLSLIVCLCVLPLSEGRPEGPSSEYGVPGFGPGGVGFGRGGFGGGFGGGRFGGGQFVGGRFGGGDFGGVEFGGDRFEGDHRLGQGNYREGGDFGYGRSGFSDDFSGDANYNFAYEVQDAQYGNDYGHEETRRGEVTQGSYHVLLPDGRVQTVQYVVDRNGYKPIVTYQGEAKFGPGIGGGRLVGGVAGDGYFYRR